MKRTRLFGGCLAAALLTTLSSFAQDEGAELPIERIPNLGEAAEAYFSPDGKSLVGTAKLEGDEAHMVYVMSLDGKEIRRINDKGRDACQH